MLLEAKADVSLKIKANGKEYTALFLAKHNGHVETVNLLTKYGAEE
jgi:hypothetical protein